MSKQLFRKRNSLRSTKHTLKLAIAIVCKEKNLLLWLPRYLLFCVLPRRTLREFIPVVLSMVLLDAFFWVLTSRCGTHIEPISRRFANLSYILWMVSAGILWAHSFNIDLIQYAYPIPSSAHIPSRTLADLPCFQTPTRRLSVMFLQYRNCQKA